jgi:hypothetical protein
MRNGHVRSAPPTVAPSACTVLTLWPSLAHPVAKPCSPCGQALLTLLDKAAHVMADEPSWFTLSEAASRSGLHKEALRARAKRGHLPSRRGNLGQVLVQLPPDLLDPAHPSTHDGAHGQLEQLAELVRDLEQELSEVRERLVKAEAERDAAVRTGEKEACLLREVLEREQVRADALAQELRELQRPWWQRLLGKYSTPASPPS